MKQSLLFSQNIIYPERRHFCVGQLSSNVWSEIPDNLKSVSYFYLENNSKLSCSLANTPVDLSFLCLFHFSLSLHI